MGLMMQMDDVEPGMYCAVLGRAVDSQIDESEQERIRPKSISGRSISVGMPFTVLAVSLPFILFACVGPGGVEYDPRILDLRSVAICQLSDEFIDAIVGPSEDPDDNKPF